MGALIFPKGWSAIPPTTARPIRGHSLCPRHGFLFGSRTVDIVNRYAGSLGGTPGATLYAPTSCQGYSGAARVHSAITDFDQLGLDSALLPDSHCTIVVGYQKSDGSPRDSVVFGLSGGVAANICTLYAPYVDSTCYWDWGGESGSNRVSVGGLTFGDDIWVACVGPRGSELWQNGIRRVSNGSDVSRTTNGAIQWQLGSAAVSAAHQSDLAAWKFLWVYHRQLREDEITRVTLHPFCWVDPRP